MVRFETLASREAAFGERNFLEVALKRAFDEGRPDDAGVTFLSVSRGYTDARGQRRYRMHFTMANDPELVAWVAEMVQSLPS